MFVCVHCSEWSWARDKSVFTAVCCNENLCLLEFNANFNNIAWNDDRLYKDNWYFPLRLLFLNSARPVSLAGDRFALGSLHQLSSLPLPARPLCTAFVINVEQLKSLTWVQARPVFLWAYITFLDSGRSRMMEVRGTGKLSF